MAVFSTGFCNTPMRSDVLAGSALSAAAHDAALLPNSSNQRLAPFCPQVDRASPESKVMADHTHIEWTDATWNPVTGCSVVSPGCTNCYAMKLAGTRLQHHPSRFGLTRGSKAGPVWTGDVRFNTEWLVQPLRWRRPRKIFVCAHGDLFHESVPDEWIDQVFAVMALCPQHIFQVLTKRSDRMRAYLTATATPGRITRPILDVAIADPSLFRIDPWPVKSIGNIDDPQDVTIALPLPNVWLGVSAEDQPRADRRIPDLLATPAAVRFLSCEPLLGLIDLRSHCDGWSFWNGLAGIRWHDGDGEGPAYSEPCAKLDWVIVGGESGPDARPMHPDWARSLRDQCAAATVPFFFKQWGDWTSIYDRDGEDPDWRRCPKPGDWSKERWLNLAGGQGFHGDYLHMMRRVGKKAAGRLLDGTLHSAFPQAPA